jgi:hypothetical protein
MEGINRSIGTPSSFLYCADLRLLCANSKKERGKEGEFEAILLKEMIHDGPEGSIIFPPETNNGEDKSIFDGSQFESITVKGSTVTQASAAADPVPAGLFASSARADWLASKMREEEQELLLRAAEALIQQRDGAMPTKYESHLKSQGKAARNECLPTPEQIGKNDQLLSAAEIVGDVAARFAGSTLTAEAQGECRDSLAAILRQYAPSAR